MSRMPQRDRPGRVTRGRSCCFACGVPRMSDQDRDRGPVAQEPTVAAADAALDHAEEAFWYQTVHSLFARGAVVTEALDGANLLLRARRKSGGNERDASDPPPAPASPPPAMPAAAAPPTSTASATP